MPNIFSTVMTEKIMILAGAYYVAGSDRGRFTTIGDWRRVSNVVGGVSISINIYAGNPGAIRRHRLNEGGIRVRFISLYNNAHIVEAE